MLLVDLTGLGLLALLGRRSGNYAGVWVWLLAMPLIGVYAVLRFDLVPTVIAIAALVVVHRRPGWFGDLVGVGAAIRSGRWSCSSPSGTGGACSAPALSPSPSRRRSSSSRRLPSATPLD